MGRGGAVLNGAADARGDGRYGALCGGGRDHVVRRVAARVGVDNEADLAGWCDVASNRRRLALQISAPGWKKWTSTLPGRPTDR